ncbi:hypothetical protein [Ruminiclostridium josui]|uniref:hypothetical protein n=1 Tax=Ruminiclostridium josui TaxID=1499 RepID=UPI0004656FD8|nr:hypothetical protein [Ruminiclostridium josui]
MESEIFRFVGIRPAQKAINYKDGLKHLNYTQDIDVNKTHSIASNRNRYTVAKNIRSYTAKIPPSFYDVMHCIYSLASNIQKNEHIEKLTHDIDAILMEKGYAKSTLELYKLIKKEANEKNESIYNILWQQLFLFAYWTYDDSQAHENVITSLRVINLIEYLTSNEIKTKNIQDIHTILNASVVIPKDFFDNKTSSSSSQNKYFKVLGVGDLKVVKQTYKGAKMGDIAYIENVLKGEFKERIHRRLDRTEDTAFLETETTKEDEKDLQNDERFSLQRESQNIISSNTDFSAGLSVSASYGQFVKLTANTNISHSGSQSETNRIASDYSREIVSRAVSKITERVKESRKSISISEIEEKNNHSFDNKTGDDNIVGIYRWVDKVYEAKIFNYGKRMLYEFIIPEPAAFYNFVNKKLKTEMKNGVKMPNALNITHKDINESNFMNFIHQYNVKGVTPPPVKLVTIGESYDIPSNPPSIVTNVTKKLKVPEGYKAVRAYAGGGGNGNNTDFQVVIGKEWRGKPQLFEIINLDGYIGEIPVAIMMKNYSGVAINVVVECERTPELYESWQIKTYTAIMEAYEAQMAEYHKQISELEYTQPVYSNSVTNREIEKKELKKWCIHLLRGEEFNFNAFKETSTEVEIKLNTIEKISENVQFFEQAFEWEQMSYVFYPYFWGRNEGWDDAIKDVEGSDPQFTKFLHAGAAKVVVPVRPSYEEALAFYTSTGKLWNGGTVPLIDDDLYVSIIDEIKSQTNDTAEGEFTGEQWEVTIPTSLVILQKSDELEA